MKVLVDSYTDTILSIAYDIDEITLQEANSEDEEPKKIYQLKDENEQPIGIPFAGQCYIYDTGNNEVINKELREAELPGKYLIEDGNIVVQENCIMNELKKVKRDATYIINTLELNQVELMYELSLLQLGLNI